MLLLTVTSSFAQSAKYYRVQIFTDDTGLMRLSSQGIGFDHGEYNKGHWFISDFSEHELDVIKHNGYQYKILISDVSSYYVKRNNIPEAEPLTQMPVTCKAYAAPKNFTFGSMGGFYTYKEMLAVLDSMHLKFPELITKRKLVSPILRTAQGRPLYYVKISDRPNQDEDEPKILYTALHHAREPESLSQLIFFMWYILENYDRNDFVKSIVDSTEMYFIPCVNPDGYIYNQKTNPLGGGLWRKNRSNIGKGFFGVDLNRNYGYMWGYDNNGSSPYRYDDSYRGPYAFSEAETQMVRDFCTTHSFFFSLNHHTFANALIYPYSYELNELTPDSILFKRYARQLAKCNSFVTGTSNQTLGYLANGDSDDWMYGEQTAKQKMFAFTAETGNSFDGFWPRKSRIIPIARWNLEMNLDAACFTKESAYKNTIATKVVDNTIFNRPDFLQAAPNPCNGYTYITYNLKAIDNNLQLQIFNTSGVRVKSIRLDTTQTKIFVNTSDLKAGVYFYFITDGKNHSAISKLVIVK